MPTAEREMETLIDVVRAIRNIRAEKKVEPGEVHRGVRRRRRGARALFEGGRAVHRDAGARAAAAHRRRRR